MTVTISEIERTLGTLRDQVHALAAAANVPPDRMGRIVSAAVAAAALEFGTTEGNIMRKTRLKEACDGRLAAMWASTRLMSWAEVARRFKRHSSDITSAVKTVGNRRQTDARFDRGVVNVYNAVSHL